MDDQTTLLVKIGGSAAFGAAVSLRFIPGNWWQRGLDDAAGRLAEFADAAHIAGLAYERSYDALTSRLVSGAE